MNPNISGFGVIGPGFLNRVLYYVTASGRAATGGIAELVEVQRSTAGRVEAKAPRGHLQRAPVNFGLRGGSTQGSAIEPYFRVQRPMKSSWAGRLLSLLSVPRRRSEAAATGSSSCFGGVYVRHFLEKSGDFANCQPRPEEGFWCRDTLKAVGNLL